MKFLVLILAALALSGTARAAEPFIAFADGEEYLYKVSWGVFSNAGEITIKARKGTFADRPVMRITTATSSRGVVRALYRYDDTAEVVIDIATGRMLHSSESGEDRKRRSSSRTDFDYERGVAVHRDEQRPHRNVDLPIPPGNPIDLISALVAPRRWDLKPGDSRDLLVHFGDDFYPITLHADSYETVSTPLGAFPTVRLVPTMDTEQPRGVFERGGEIKVWISEGSPRLPVKMQLKLKIGTATLLLKEYTPPVVTTVSTA